MRDRSNAGLTPIHTDMFDDINAYFHENVWITYKSYSKKHNIRSAGISEYLKLSINFATVLYHLREHIPKEKQKTKKQLIEICPDYKLLADIVNASKHNNISNDSPLISRAEDIYEAIVITEYKDKLGPFRHIEIIVYVKLNDGSERILHDILINVLNMWLVELNQLGIIGTIEPVKMKNARLPRRSKYSDKLNFSAIQGVRFRQVIKMQKYNYDKRCIEPINLIDNQIKMNIYAQVFECSLTLIKHDKNDEITITISMTQEQKDKLEKLANDNDRLVYLLKLAREQGRIIDFNT